MKLLPQTSPLAAGKVEGKEMTPQVKAALQSLSQQKQQQPPQMQQLQQQQQQQGLMGSLGRGTVSCCVHSFSMQPLVLV